MTNSDLLIWLPVLFPFMFAAIWLTVTTLLSIISGWNRLQDRYPDRPDPARKTLSFQSGALGGVNYRNCLTLTATPTGLRIATWWIFAPFKSPILVPWSEIHAQPQRMLLGDAVRLGFGNPETGRLRLFARTWHRLVEASPNADARLRTRP